ncbi:RNA polymerase II transcription factor B subunit 1 [Ascosphaera atra]|nr:RNA polymerase II transcription factor B subunit 1 [Ascosphaera atra]
MDALWRRSKSAHNRCNKDKEYVPKESRNWHCLYCPECSPDTDLQQTPAGKPKVMLKILTTVTKEGEPDNYVFHFTSPTNARAEADAIKEVLQTAINNVKASQTPQPAGEAGASAGGTMAIAGALAPKAAKPLWEDDQRLLADIELQQSLLKANSALQRIFMESLSTKSENVANSRFVAQFWSTRLPLLRAHAFERSQQRGSYNVLASLKPRTEGAAMKLNISKEQISLIFNQHPLVKRAYDENVPQVSEQQFWSRFFQSRLFKKLRGERISENDASDSVLDKYLHVDEKEAEKPDTRIPHFIDLYGNEENHSQRLGNRPEIDMRPSTLDRVPIIRTLNSLSEKIMSNVSPSDVDPAAPVGMSEEEFDRHQLMLRDLEGDAEVKRFVLNIRDQSKLFSGGKPESQEMEVGAESHPVRVQDPRKSIKRLRNEVESTYPNDSADLASIVEPGDSDEDSDEETQRGQQPKKKKTEHMGSKSSMQRASNQILDALRTRRAQEEAPASKDNKADTFGLSRTIFDRLTLTHATSTEFLHQFWQAYLSGDPDRANEVASLHESLLRARGRIDAVEKDAEAERQAEIERVHAQAREMFAATGRKVRPNIDRGIVGGGAVVRQLLGPTRTALDRAIQDYKKALVAAQAQAQAQAQVQGGANGYDSTAPTTPQPSAA